MAPRYETKISRRELREYKKVHGMEVSPSKKSSLGALSQKDDEKSSRQDASEEEKKSGMMEVEGQDDWESAEEEEAPQKK